MHKIRRRVRYAWHVLRGRPLATGLEFVVEGRIVSVRGLDGRPHGLVEGCAFFNAPSTIGVHPAPGLHDAQARAEEGRA